MFEVNNSHQLPFREDVNIPVPPPLPSFSVNMANFHTLHLQPKQEIKVKACMCASGHCLFHTPESNSEASSEVTKTIQRFEASTKPGQKQSSTSTSISSTAWKSRPSTSKTIRPDHRPQSSISAAVMSSRNKIPVMPQHDELKLSLSSLNPTTRRNDSRERSSEENEAQFQRWLAEKNENKRRLEEERQLFEETLIREQAKKIEMERKNFISWLAAKKAAEKKQQEEIQRQQEEAAKKILEEKSHRRLESKLNYQLWCKKKEEKELERKLREQVVKMHEVEQKSKRCQMNCAAYERWLENSRNRPKPLPLNQGLHTLRSSLSVSYVNPAPWQPNISPRD